MLQVYERTYRLYVLTYKIWCFRGWDKLLSASTSTEIHRDSGITVRSSGQWFCPMSNKNAGLYLQDLQSICSEFKRIELYWNRIVHQNALAVWSSLQPDHDTNKSPRRMQVSPPAEERWQVADLKAETFEDLWYLFSSEDKYKGFSLYQREDWLIDWNQLQLCQF